MNNNHIKRLNSSAEKVIGHFYSEFHSPEQSKKFAKKVQEVYSNNKSAFDELNKINPGVKVLLSSGYNLNGEAGKIINRGCVGFIQKPFTIRDISVQLKKIIKKTKTLENFTANGQK